MNLAQHVYLYCERGSSAYWSEPANALTNLAFVVSALATWRILSRDADVPASIAFMPPLMVLIGVGSFTFHTLATRWAQVLDIAPIGVFVLCYLASFLRWFYGLPWRWCLLGVAAFACSDAAFAGFAGGSVPNRSAIYVPVLLLMVGLAGALRISGDAMSGDGTQAGYWQALALAGAVFAVALVARTVDRSVCNAFPLGSHFLWHLLTGYLVFVVSRPLIRRWRAVRAREGSGAPVRALQIPARSR